MKRFSLFGLFLIMLMMTPGLFAQNPQTIIKKSEEIRRGVNSSKSDVTMTIVRPSWQREVSMKMWTKGEDYALILVTGPARDKGTANLKRIKEIWNYVPRIDRTIKLPRSMMSQSWMGSDFKNEDLVRENSIITDYSHRLMNDSTIEDRSCYKIELIPNDDAAVIWGKVIIFIDKKDYLQLRTEFYDEDLYLVNIMNASGIKPMGGKVFATKLEMIPVEEEGQKTIFTYHSIVFDAPIKESFFTLQNMKRVR